MNCANVGDLMFHILVVFLFEQCVAATSAHLFSSDHIFQSDPASLVQINVACSLQLKPMPCAIVQDKCGAYVRWLPPTVSLNWTVTDDPIALP